MFGMTKSAWLVLIAVVLVTFANVTLKRVPLAAVVIFGEHLPPVRIAGRVLIFVGVILVGQNCINLSAVAGQPLLLRSPG